jgi:undecaprenyl diphosphate synthase
MMKLDPKKLPRHVAIIMDGNGRWAKRHHLARVIGHRKGADSVREIVRACREFGIEVLTLFAFSTENWLRPKREVTALMRLLGDYIDSELQEMIEKGIRLKVIGKPEDLPQRVRSKLEKAKERTKDNSNLILNLALSYGGRSEILRAFQRLLGRLRKGELQDEDLSEEVISCCMDTSGLPDPDLLIRTSGECRVSNFLLWQVAYAEIYFSETLWPDFGKEELLQALLDYEKRERRFGLTTEQLRKREVEHLGGS